MLASFRSLTPGGNHQVLILNTHQTWALPWWHKAGGIGMHSHAPKAVFFPTFHIPSSAVPCRDSGPQKWPFPLRQGWRSTPSLCAGPDGQEEASPAGLAAFFLEEDESKPASSWLLPWCPVQEKRERWWWLGWAMNVGRSLKEGEPWKQESEAQRDVLNSL